MKVNEQVKNAVAGTVGVIGGELIYNTLKPNMAFADSKAETTTPQPEAVETKDTPQVETEQNPIETTHKGSVFDIKYEEESDFNEVDAEEALSSLLDEPVEDEVQLEGNDGTVELTSNFEETNSSFEESVSSDDYSVTDNIVENDILATSDMGITDQDLGMA